MDQDLDLVILMVGSGSGFPEGSDSDPVLREGSDPGPVFPEGSDLDPVFPEGLDLDQLYRDPQPCF